MVNVGVVKALGEMIRHGSRAEQDTGRNVVYGWLWYCIAIGVLSDRTDRFVSTSEWIDQL
jgi:hypothetical protein